MNSSETYKNDGVDVELGDQISSYAFSVCKNTYKNSPFIEIVDMSKHFRGLRGFRPTNLPDGSFFDLALDGVGTKVVIIDAAESHKNSYQDVMAMCNGDITRAGGLPVIFSSVLDVSTLGEDQDTVTFKNFKSMFDGLVELANEQGIVAWKGETAELGACVGSENQNAVNKFNIAGVAFGVYHPDRLITGNIEPGDVVIALKEYGFRSNGISSVRKALAIAFGPDWMNKSEAQRYIQMAAEPSKLYDKFLAALNGWYPDEISERIPVKAIAHVTGGGIVGKFGEDILFPSGHSAYLSNLFVPPEVMSWAKDVRKISDEEVYHTWNGGQGVLLVVPHGQQDCVTRYAEQFGIEVRIAGTIDQTSSGQKPELQILSRFSKESPELIYTA